jgi:hypothetical protein
MAPNAGKASKLWLWADLHWGAAEGSLFFVVPDVLISLVALRRGFRLGAIVAVIAAAGAMLGGSLIHGWSARDPDAARAAVAAVPAVSETMIVDAEADMVREGWLLAALKGPLTSTPYKVYAMLAPARGAHPVAWSLAAFPVRLPRFLLVAAGFAILRRLLAGRVSPRRLLGAFTVGWVLFYGWFWLAHPG